VKTHNKKDKVNEEDAKKKKSLETKGRLDPVKAQEGNMFDPEQPCQIV
jgi:hypothetical protein